MHLGHDRKQGPKNLFLHNFVGPGHICRYGRFDDALIDIRRITSLVFKHGQRCNFLPRQQEGNPMNWVSQRTTSDYRAIVMTPKQAFEVLLNIPEPRRTLTLSDAATALRVSELLGLMWMDLDFEGLVIYVRRAYV